MLYIKIGSFGVIVSIREKYEYEKLEISLTIVDSESKVNIEIFVSFD